MIQILSIKLSVIWKLLSISCCLSKKSNHQISAQLEKWRTRRQGGTKIFIGTKTKKIFALTVNLLRICKSPTTYERMKDVKQRCVWCEAKKKKKMKNNNMSLQSKLFTVTLKYAIGIFIT